MFFVASKLLKVSIREKFSSKKSFSNKLVCHFAGISWYVWLGKGERKQTGLRNGFNLDKDNPPPPIVTFEKLVLLCT